MIRIEELDELKYEIEHNKVCLIKISTSTCGPCKLVQSNIESIEPKFPGVAFINVDAEECSDDIIMEYKVRSVPVVIVTKNGQVVNQTVGLQTTQQLEERLLKEIK